MGRTQRQQMLGKGIPVLLAVLLCASCLFVPARTANAAGSSSSSTVYAMAKTECFLRMLDNTFESAIADSEESSGKVETATLEVNAGGTGATTLVGDLKGGWGTVTLQWFRATAGADSLAARGISADGEAAWSLVSTSTVAAENATDPNTNLEGNPAQALNTGNLPAGTYAYKLVATDELGYERTIWWVVQVNEAGGLESSLESAIADREEQSGDIKVVAAEVNPGEAADVKLTGDLSGGWGTVTLKWYEATAGVGTLAQNGISADAYATWKPLSQTAIAADSPTTLNAALAGNAAQALDLSGLQPGSYAYKLVASDEQGFTRTLWWIVQVDEVVAPAPTPSPEPTPAPAPAPVKPATTLPKTGELIAMLPLVTAVFACLLFFVFGKRRKDEEEEESAASSR